MTKEEIISGLKFTIDMFLFDPTTGEVYTEPRNDMDKTTIDACRGAIELLEQEPCEDEYIKVPKEDRIVENYKELLKECYWVLTPVNPQPKMGHWFIDERPESNREIICSNCEQPIFKYHKLDFDYRPKYCPNCGARMTESEG